MSERVVFSTAAWLLSLVACTPRGTSSTLAAPPSPLPACAPERPESYPCRTPFDVAPVIEHQPTDVRSGSRRAVRVWAFVDTAGTVKAAQIERGAGVDYDIAAVALAKRFRFVPATAGGRPVPAWVLLPVVTTPVAEGCPQMAVPLSAGLAQFADSAVLERPELGTHYRFRGTPEISLGALIVDVYVYPAADWSPPPGQAKVFLETLDTLQRRGTIVGYELHRSDREAIQLGVRGRTSEVVGHVVRLSLMLRPGELRESYFGVFPHGNKYVKFRATYTPSREARAAVDTIVRQIMSARFATPPHCPR